MSKDLELALRIVAPLAGAWIETLHGMAPRDLDPSRPSRARGLKPDFTHDDGHVTRVAPLAGAWIETDAQDTTAATQAGRAPRGRVD